MLDPKLRFKNKEGSKIKEEIERIINSKQISHLFIPHLKSFSEYNILCANGEVLRPDRVVIHSKDFASLIDYKTGEERVTHYNQMKKYESVLFKMGYKTIDKYLIYLTKSDVIKL